jgi:hypothetical protein
MTISLIDIQPEKFQIKPDHRRMLHKVNRYIGYSNDSALNIQPQRINDTVSSGLKEIHIQFKICETPLIDWQIDTIQGAGIVVDSMRWTRLVRNMLSPERLCCFVITLGSDFDQWVKRIGRQSIFNAYIADACGSVFIEEAADKLSGEIEKNYSKYDMNCSRRFSPGYCDWRLDVGQKAIFQFLKPEDIGVTCLQTGMMMPEKTLSAVIISAKQMPAKTPCLYCVDQKCRHRRE